MNEKLTNQHVSTTPASNDCVPEHDIKTTYTSRTPDIHIEIPGVCFFIEL